MAASQEQKVDFLLKKIGYTASKTGIAEDETGISGTKKAPFAEPIPSPLTLPGANIWSQSNQIPATPPGATTSVVRVYKTGTAQQLTFDSTVADNRSFVSRETPGEVTSTVVGDWVDTQFGSDYIVKVYKGDPNSGGVQLSAAGSGSNDTWFFDYSAGVLNFNGTNVPSGITTTNIYIEGYRYTGIKGITGVAQTFTDLDVSGIATFNGAVDMNSTLDVDGDTQLDDLNVAGVATFSNTVDVNADLNVSGLSTFIQVSVNAGVVTFTNVSSTPSDTLPVGTGGHIYSFDDGLRIVGDNGGIRFHSAGFARWKIDTAGTFAPLSTDGLDIGSSIYPVSNLIVSGNAGIGSLNITGVSTFANDINANGNIIGDNATNISGINSVTATNVFSNLTGNVVGNLTGNADTAGKADGLTTARTIGGVSFDGSANINLPGVNTSGNQDTSGNAATATALETARNIGGVSFDGTASINLPGVNQAGNQNTSGTAAGLSGSPTITITDVSGVGGNFTGIVTANKFVGGGINTEATSSFTDLEIIKGLTVGGISTFSDGINLSSGQLIVATSIKKASGTLDIFADTIELSNAAANSTLAQFTNGAAAKLYFNGSNKFETTNTGAVVTGILTATSFSGNLATTDLTGTITNAQLAGSIANDKLANSTVSYGGVSLALGSSDATPAFDLSDATNYPTSSLSGTITNAQLAGSIANDKLANSTVSYGGISLALGGTDATPAFNLSDATNYPFTSLTGITTSILGDTTPTLGGNLNGNSKSIFGVGVLTATSFSGTLITAAQPNVTSLGTLSSLTVSGNINANGNIVGDSSTNITGIAGVTASTLTGTLQTAAQPNITSVGTLSSLNVTGNVSVGGTLTYEDVTNIDSVGLVTARNGVRITAGGLDVTGVSTFSGNITGTGDLTLTSTDDGSSAAPIINLFRNSASPDDADYLGQIKFQGESDTGVQRNYAKITGKILDASNGTEDGIIEFAHIKAGSQTITGRFRSDSLQLLNGTALSVAGDITANGNIAGDGSTNITGINEITAAGNITANGNIIGDNSTNISGINSVTATSFFGNGGNLTGVGTQGSRVEAESLTVSGISTLGITTVSSLNVSGISTFGKIIATSNINAITANVTTTNTAIAVQYDGTTYGSLTPENGAGSIGELRIKTSSNRNVVLSANSSGGTSGNVHIRTSGKTELTVPGTGGVGVAGILTATGINLTQGDGRNAGATGILTAVNINSIGGNFTGVVTASSFSGDGSALTGVGFNADAQENLYAGTSAGAGSDADTCFNVALGFKAACTLNEGDHNVALGTYALKCTTSGIHNVMIGSYSGRCNQTGSCNIAIGRGAMQGGDSLTSGTERIGIGRNALRYATGSCSIGIGAKALAGASSGTVDGTNNIGIGKYAGELHTTGSYNIFLGAKAGHRNTTGNRNIAMGDMAMGCCTVTGHNNIVMGCKAGLKFSSANNNIVLGNYAMRLGVNVSATNVIAIGQQAGRCVTSAQSNVLIGIYAGGGVTTEIGNVYLGAQAGLVATGANNISIGKYAGCTQTAGDRNIIIGCKATLPVLDGSDQVLLSNGGSDTNSPNTVFYGCCSGGCTLTGIGTNYPDNVVGSAVTSKLAVGVVSAYQLYGDGSALTGISAGFSQDDQANLVAGDGAGAAKDADTCFNIMIGCNSGAALNEGDHNVLLGCNSGCKLTSGCQNVFLGQNAGCNGTTVNNSVFIGNLAGKGQSTNGQNVAIGAEAMCCGGTGFHNVALGSGAGKCITSGSKNVAIGFCAMFSANVTGAYNVAFGHYASCRLTSGNNNVAVGTCAGRKNQTGSGNVHIGPFAGCNNQGSGNIMIGEESGRSIGGHDNNIFIGKYAACAQSQGSCNIAIGCHVCLAICSGTGSSNQLAIGVGGDRWITGNCDYNVGIGTTNPSSRLSVAGDACVSGVITASNFAKADGSSLGGFEPDSNENLYAGTSSGEDSSTNTCFNIGIGYSAGANLNGNFACYNVLMGHKAGNAITSGGNNIAMGCNAAANMTEGACNIAIGKQSLGSGTLTGALNIAIGCLAGNTITSGNNNIFMGAFTGAQSTDAYSNVFIGESAGGYVSGAANRNVALGHCAGYRITTGRFNIMLGNCTVKNGPLSGDDNFIVGRRAGLNLSSGDDNVFLGKYAGCTVTSGCSNIIIGASVNPLSATGGCQLAIGKDTNRWIVGNSDFNVGIGSTTNPTSRLTVTGDVNISGVATATDFDSTSDIRLKTNIKPIDDPVSKVIQIEGVSFNWKKDDRPALGVIADQVEQILPQLVHGDDPKTVNYNGLVGLLIEVVKDQQKQIDSLNDRISKLE